MFLSLWVLWKCLFKCYEKVVSVYNKWVFESRKVEEITVEATSLDFCVFCRHTFQVVMAEWQFTMHQEPPVAKCSCRALTQLYFQNTVIPFADYSDQSCFRQCACFSLVYIVNFNWLEMWVSYCNGCWKRRQLSNGLFLFDRRTL